MQPLDRAAPQHLDTRHRRSLPQQVDQRRVLLQLDGGAAHRVHERRLESGAGRIAAGVQDPRTGVGTLEPARELAAGAIEAHPPLLQSGDRRGTAGAEHLDRVAHGQPCSGGQRVLDVQRHGVGRSGDRGDPALCGPGWTTRRARPW
ncbi:hypothetical protein ACH61_02604 [Rathayibacter tanaceti]|uniref:Uncharacterized protein n=1 Tax=Rathayibacter tanaceti TaxID=1671680 RepID=A0A166HB26_9MICO|nr:hypothetical protein ACH61_02604 [Rathayibacter tanaceti]